MRYSRITPIRFFQGEREVGAAYCSSENLTDSAVKSSPLWNLTPLRRCQRSTVGEACSHFVTSHGTGLVRSSRKTKPSNMCEKIDQPGPPASTRGSRWPGSSDRPTTSSGPCARAGSVGNPLRAAAPPAAASFSISRRVTRIRVFMSVVSRRSAWSDRGPVQLRESFLDLLQFSKAAIT
jgi:hypothetical protein